MFCSDSSALARLDSIFAICSCNLSFFLRALRRCAEFKLLILTTIYLFVYLMQAIISTPRTVAVILASVAYGFSACFLVFLLCSGHQPTQMAYQDNVLQLQDLVSSIKSQIDVPYHLV